MLTATSDTSGGVTRSTGTRDAVDDSRFLGRGVRTGRAFVALTCVCPARGGEMPSGP